MTQQSGAKGQLAVRLGTWNLMFAMDEVAEIIPIPRVTQVLGVKSWLMGIANSRGTVISVIDLREFLGGKPTIPTPNSRLVVVRSGEWHYGLLTDEIIGMRHLGLEKKAIALETIDGNLQPYAKGAFESDGQKWFVFDVGRLLNAPEFLNAAV